MSHSHTKVCRGTVTVVENCTVCEINTVVCVFRLQFCLPLLLEKLSSDIQSAKLDSLLTLATGAAVYGLAGLKPFLQEIWSSIKREVCTVPSLYTVQ